MISEVRAISWVKIYHFQGLKKEQSLSKDTPSNRLLELIIRMKIKLNRTLRDVNSKPQRLKYSKSLHPLSFLRERRLHQFAKIINSSQIRITTLFLVVRPGSHNGQSPISCGSLLFLSCLLSQNQSSNFCHFVNNFGVYVAYSSYSSFQKCHALSLCKLVAILKLGFSHSTQ